MPVHTSKKGLDLPIAGEASDGLSAARTQASTRVALLGDDYPGLRPTMHVKVGDDVRRGGLLFEDKKIPGVRFTSPAAGTVKAIHRGERRAFQSVVIELSSAEQDGSRGSEAVSHESFDAFTGKSPSEVSRDDVRALLLDSGLWTSLRERPFGRVADPATIPHSVFVTAIDTNPLAPHVDAVIAERQSEFENGLAVLGKLTDGPVYVCTAAAPAFNVPDTVRQHQFQGPHPAGTVGYHIHCLDPVGRNKTVWHINYQDVAAVGALFATGKLDVERVITVAGPAVSTPQYVRTRIGANVDELSANALSASEPRVISGSVLSGRRAMGEAGGYLGRYHLQVSVIAEYREREFLGWLTPGGNKFSFKSAFLSTFTPGKKFEFTTTTNGSHRAIVPIGSYEGVMPMDILPTFLLRAIVMGDIERAEQLGCLELDEEDVALCSFVCPGKIDYGVHLRSVLETLKKEG